VTPRKKPPPRNPGRAILFWSLLVVVVALTGSTLMGRFRGGPSTDPRVDDGSIATRIEILNGSGRAGAGSHLAAALTEAGFQVVEVRNADRFDYPKTLVVARTEDLRGARRVAHLVGNARVIRQRSLVDWDVTVVIGRDRSDRS
jgi:hypothetical protein